MADGLLCQKKLVRPLHCNQSSSVLEEDVCVEGHPTTNNSCNGGQNAQEVRWWPFVSRWERSGNNQMSPTDQGSSTLTRLPHPRVIAAKLFNCPKLPSNDVDLVPINNQLSVERWICFHKLSQTGNQLMVTSYWFPSWEVVSARFLKLLLSIFPITRAATLLLSSW